MADEYYAPLQPLAFASNIDCYQYNLSDVEAGYWAYIGASVAVTIILMGLWFVYREYFPIKERSPYLVMTTLFGNMLVQVSFPAAFINDMDGDMTNKPVRDILWGFLLFGGICLFLPYIWRAVRLQYAFDWKIESKSLEYLYSRQSLMCLITLLAALVYSVILLALLQQNALVFYSIEKASVAHFAVFTSMYFLDMLFMITTCYRLRFVKSEFNFQREIVLVIIILFVSFNINVFLYDSIQGCFSQLAFSSSMILVNIRNWLIVAITAVHPLFIATKVHCFLSQGVVVNLFQYVIGDDTCMQAFEEYIWTGKERLGTLLHSSAYEPTDEIELLRVFLSLRRRIMDDKSTQRIIKRMMEDYVDNQRVADLFPPVFIYELKVKYRESREGGEPMTVQEFKKLEGFCILYFLDVFDRRFKMTKSFYYIRDLFQKNEIINKKMQALNMFAIS